MQLRLADLCSVQLSCATSLAENVVTLVSTRRGTCPNPFLYSERYYTIVWLTFVQNSHVIGRSANGADRDARHDRVATAKQCASCE